MALEAKDNILTAKVTLHNYRFPKDKAPHSGDFAIVLFNVVEAIEGQVNPKAYSRYDRAIVVTGNMPKIERGVEYILQAKLVQDQKWGYQYQCESIRMNYDLEDADDQKKFLGYFLTQNQIDILYESVEDPFTLLKTHDVENLTKIKGIGPVTASRMCIKYSENINNGRAYVELKELGLTKNAIDKLIKQFNSADAVVDLITENPYQLIKLVRGYGWEKADSIARAQGFSTGCKERCLAYAQYRLEKNADDGNSCMSIKELVDETYEKCYPVQKEDLLNYLKEDMIGQTDFEDLFQKIINKEPNLKYPTFFYSKENQKVGLFSYRLLERNILRHLKRLVESPKKMKYDKEKVEEIIVSVEQEQGYNYTLEQRRAIYSILDNNVSILTGSGGTGKSSTVKPLIHIFKYYNKEVSQCALSGRAASLLTEYTKLEGKTIHRLLRYLPEEERFACNENDPIKSDVIILDETSMVGEDLFYSLLSAIQSGSKLIMLGDMKQLPPLSVGNLLSDCIASGFIPTTSLVQIHRQALLSGIISEAHRVCEGKPLAKNDFSGEEIRGELKDFKLITYTEPLLVHAKAVEEFKHLLEKGISPDDIQIVVPVRSRGMNSCRFFNAEIQALVNGIETYKDKTIDMIDNGQKFQVTYRPGDKIMVLKNNYHARTVYGKEVSIFNGNMGHIDDIDEDTMVIDLEEQGKVILGREEWYNIIHAWACTCHKLQGSQTPYAIVCLDNSAYTMLMREWLYTAITRAKKYCALVGQPKAINTACRTSNVKIKQTWLREDLKKEYCLKMGI